MSLTIEWGELLPWAPVFVPAAAVSLLWWIRRRREAKEFAEAETCLTEGRYIECLRHLSVADERWSFNVANSTPKTVVRDIDRLVALVALIGSALNKAGSPCDTSELIKSLQRYRSIYADKHSFKFGSHTLKSDIAPDVARLSHEISALRSQLRNRYKSLLHQ